MYLQLCLRYRKYAFRYDAPGKSAAQAGSFGVMHHNIADNTLGLMIKGNNQIIAHNTVLNTIVIEMTLLFLLRIVPIQTLGYTII